VRNALFKIGDVVRLRSGGPAMTVKTEDDGDGQVECQWFEKRKAHSSWFPAKSLTESEPDGQFQFE
jgi:uncharacterized protein YodC (DUF2158 family)